MCKGPQIHQLSRTGPARGCVRELTSTTLFGVRKSSGLVCIATATLNNNSVCIMFYRFICTVYRCQQQNTDNVNKILGFPRKTCYFALQYIVFFILLSSGRDSAKRRILAQRD